jgi:hypothetical protein
MKRDSTLRLIILLLIDELKAILYFPLWWYSAGLFNVVKGCGKFINDFQQTLGFMIWVKNLFVPMFGQRDIAGRIISFFLRLVQIIFRGVIVLIFCVLNLIFIIIWILLPIFVLYEILIQL